MLTFERTVHGGKSMNQDVAGASIWRISNHQIRLAGVVSLALVILQAVLVGASYLTHPEGHWSPFIPYEMALPRQSLSGLLTAEVVICPEQVRGYQASVTYCAIRLKPNDPSFTSASALVYQNRVVRIEFEAHNLHMIDVIAHWGQPTLVKEQADHIQLEWLDEGLYATVTFFGTGRLYSNHLPIRSFAIGVSSFNASVAVN